MIFFTILDQLEILDSIKNISDIMRCNQTMNTWKIYYTTKRVRTIVLSNSLGVGEWVILATSLVCF